MVFKFDFSLEEEVGREVDGDGDVGLGEAPGESGSFTELGIGELLAALPEVILFSPLCISGDIYVSKRDLFDARCDLAGTEDDALRHLASDVMPGTYEGGLKTWECSVDLAGFLARAGADVRGKRVLEVGCGTGVPSVYLLRNVFAGDLERAVHFQDYNESVLRLVTFPNVLLAWYMSPAAAPYRSAHPHPAPDPSLRGALPVTPALKSAFLATLSARAVSLRFFAGPWTHFAPACAYDVVLTAETIYRTAHLPALLRVLRMAPVCLVAAKVVYFGVGGGVALFRDAVERAGGRVEVAWERRVGVGRVVLCVRWP